MGMYLLEIWNRPGTLTIVNCNINTEKYREILDNEVWPVVVFHRMTLSFKMTMHQCIVQDPCLITKLIILFEEFCGLLNY